MAEADHRIANHFAMLAGYVNLKAAEVAKGAGQPTKRETLLLLEAIAVQISAVARIHRMLAINQSEPHADLGEALHEICSAFRSGPSKVVLHEAFESGCVMQFDQILPVTQIFAEVVTNSLKHASMAEFASRIHTSCRSTETGELILEVSDEGNGIPENFNPQIGQGLGFRLIRTLSDKVGGTIEYTSSSQGLNFKLTLPHRPKSVSANNAH